MDIVIDKLNMAYGEKQVLRDYSARFPHGETTVIMGPSGCGKTTLLSVLMGFLQPDSGEIRGLPEKISAVFQEDRLCEDFSSLSNVAMVLSKKSDEPERLLRRLGLGEELKTPVKALSGGMKRRVAIARALCYEGELLILDEPFKGLDKETRKTVMAVVAEETKGRTVIAVTHDPEEAAFLSGNILRMEPVGA